MYLLGKVKTNNIDNPVDITKWLPKFSIAAESDNNLMDYFLKTNYLNSILYEKEWLVIGRKGSGKTAIFKYLVSQNKKKAANYYSVIPLTFESYPWKIHKKYIDNKLPNKTAYKKSWKYLLYTVLLSNIIQQKVSRHETLSNELKKVRKFFNCVYSNSIIGTKNVMLRNMESISSLGISLFGIGASIGMDTKSQEGINEKVDDIDKIDAISSFFEELVNQEIGKDKYLILLDELDEVWSTSERDTYRGLLSGLIAECSEINNSHVSKGVGDSNSIKVCPFLRTEIYEDLDFNDKNKTREDSSIEIKWSADTLDAMFFSRVQALLREWNKNNPAQKFEIQGDSFASDSSSRIFNQSSVRHQISPFKHILRMSFYRPRDVIIYMNKIRKVHKKEEGSLYTSSELRTAEQSYSNSIYNELSDEFEALESDKRFEELLTVLSKIHRQTFSLSDFKNVYKRDDQECKKRIEFLFNISILGQRIGRNWSYRFDDPELIIDFSKPFYVNPALKNYLHLIEGAK